jgi:RNA polymerase sigma-70 factor, ECF subfamily
LSAPPDLEALLARVAQSDRLAYGALYQAVGPKLFAVCLRMMSERAEAEDALQDVMLKIWQNAASFDRERGNALAWVYAVARNTCLDRLRAARRGPRIATGGDDGLDLLNQQSDPAANAESTLIARADMARVLACMAELPEERARALQGAYLQGYSYQDLASRAGVPLNTMRTWLRRALISLRECLAR